MLWSWILKLSVLCRPTLETRNLYASPCSTVKLAPFGPLPLIRMPSGEGSCFPLVTAMPCLVAGLVPVADQHGVLAGRRIEGDGDQRAAADADGAKAAGGLVEGERREVEEAADLVLGLHLVGEVLARRDRAVRAGHAVLPRVLPVLKP
ncbi:Os04g0561950 [Oryza sativa Japonica Group]|uniref:Os04g0561950 protein n=1 Tax=Oryza sativa subsp. japonica TaxID=39947 RepID=A0A0P0WDG5_ORYSJ|nr:hypothetical protein EE612_024912 [Oryza sativa]BAS90483.1 Os04g0561950 [Oryza sativa Japonica Group]